MSQLVKKFGFDSGNIHMENAVEFAVSNLEHANNEVRQAAGDLILEAFKLVGLEEVEPLLTGREVLKQTCGRT